MEDEVLRIETDDVGLVLLVDDITSRAPLKIKISEDSQGCDVTFEFSEKRLGDAEKLANEILEQVAFFRSVRKRSEQLTAAFAPSPPEV